MREAMGVILQRGYARPCRIVTLRRSIGKPYSGDQAEDDAEDALKEKWLKWAWRRFAGATFQGV
jgi:hypothetical protein